MKISKIDISFIDTNDISINIWLPGCKLNCNKCFTPDLKNFNNGIDLSIEDLVLEVKRRMDLTNVVCLIGGNPPDHEFIYDIVKGIKTIGATIWLYSGYEFEKIKDEEWAKYCDYIKAGPYIDEKKDPNYFLASTNQKLFKKINDEWIKLEGLEYA